MIKIDTTKMNYAFGLMNFATTTKLLDEVFSDKFRMLPEQERNDKVRKFQHQLEVMTNLDDYAHRISKPSSEDDDPCLDEANLSKYDEMKELMESFVVLDVPMDVLEAQFRLMTSYVFTNPEVTPDEIVSSIIISAIDGNILPLTHLIKRNDIDNGLIADKAKSLLKEKYNEEVMEFLVKEEIFTEDDPELKKIRITMANPLLNVGNPTSFDDDFKIEYYTRLEVEQAMEGKYDEALRSAKKHYKLANGYEMADGDDLNNVSCDVIYYFVNKNDAESLTEFLDRIEGDEGFDPEQTDDALEGAFEGTFENPAIMNHVFEKHGSERRMDVPDETRMRAVINTWKKQHGFEELSVLDLTDEDDE